MRAAVGIRRIGWIGTVAFVAPKKSGDDSKVSPSGTRRLSQTWSNAGPRQSVNRLTLSALDMISSKSTEARASGKVS